MEREIKYMKNERKQFFPRVQNKFCTPYEALKVGALFDGAQ